MWITSMGNHGAAGGISERRRSSCSGWTSVDLIIYINPDYTIWSIGPDVSGTRHNRVGRVALAPIAQDCCPMLPVGQATVIYLGFRRSWISSTSARSTNELRGLDCVAVSCLLALAVAVRWHAPLDIAHGILYRPNMSAPPCLCTTLFSYDEMQLNRLGSHKLVIASCSLCPCTYNKDYLHLDVMMYRSTTGT